MRNGVQALLVSALLAFFAGPCALKAQTPDEGREVEEHLTIAQEAAAVRLLAVLKHANPYPTIKPECFLLEFEEETNQLFKFALRFDESKCGGNSPSNLIDRFAIKIHTGSVLYYDPISDQFQSFKWFLRRQGK